MTEKWCPSEAELMSHADGDAPPEQLERVERHLKQCGPCARQAAELSELIADIAAPVVTRPLAVSEHVASVMSRLDAPERPRRRALVPAWGGALAAAAAVALLLGLGLGRNGQGPEEFAARGGPTESSLSRDIGVELYARESGLRSLASGSRVHAGTAFTAGLVNLGKDPAFLLLFGVDSKGAVHWIAPAFTEIGSDPESAPIAPARTERLLGSAVVFDEPAPGPLRVVAVITREPQHVSNIERLAPSELVAEALLKRFPRAEVRQFLLEVAP